MRGSFEKMDDGEFIQDLRRGDAEAARLTLAWVSAAVERMVKHGIVREPARDDLVQEAIKEVWKSLQNGHYQYRSSLRTYIWSIAAIVCLQHGRRARNGWGSLTAGHDVDVVDPTLGPYEIAEQSEQRRIFIAARRRAPQRCQKIWQMLFELGMNYQEIAEAQGLSYENTRMIYRRCKDKLIGIVQKLTATRPAKC